MKDQLRPSGVSIADGVAESSELMLAKHTVITVMVDAAFDGASLALQTWNDLTSAWTPIQNQAGVAQTIVIGAGESANVDPDVTNGHQRIRFVSDAPQAGAASEIRPTLREAP